MGKGAKVIVSISTVVQLPMVMFALKLHTSVLPLTFISEYKGLYSFLLGALFCLGAVFTLRQERAPSRFISFEAAYLTGLSLAIGYFFLNFPMLCLPALLLNFSQLLRMIPGDVYKKIIRIACLSVIIAAALALACFAVANIFFADFGSREESTLDESPKGRFELVLVKISEGALGGSQEVSVRANKPALDLGIFGHFQYQETLYQGKWSEQIHAAFVDEFTTEINGTVYLFP